MPEQQKGDRKTYFVDDEVLRYDSKAPERLSQGNRVRIPLYILRRIEDRSKMARSEEEAVVARQISQCLAPYENCGLLGKGAASKSGGIITVTSGFHLTRKSKHSQREADLPNNIGLDADTRIIHEALAWKKAHPHETVVLVSRNFFLRLTAQSCGLAAEDYRHDRIGSLDPGTAEIELADGDVSDIFNLMQRKPECAVDADVVLRAATQKVSLVPNQFCKISRRSFKKPQGDTMFCIYKAGESPLLRLVEKLAQTKTRFIVPRNLEQRFLYKALLDAEIRIVAAGGPAGTGKTVCAMQAGYELLRQDLFDQILVVRPHTDVGEPLGFLPGTVD